MAPQRTILESSRAPIAGAPPARARGAAAGGGGPLRALIALIAALAAGAAGAQTAIHHVDGDSPEDMFGFAIAAAGDVDGDGRGDLIVGAYADDDHGASAGSAVVLSGRDGSVLHRFDGDGSFHQFGRAVGGGGDVDGDGRDDVIVGAPLFMAGQTSYARVFSGADGSVLHTLTSGVTGDAFGRAVATAGDVDGDGHVDLVVGAPDDDTVAPAAGAAWVFSGADGSVLYTFHGEGQADQLGFAVDGAGDVDRDGFADVVVGAPFDDVDFVNAGSVHVFSGADGSLLYRFEGEFFQHRFGESVSDAGDVDGDGRPDVLVGASPDPTHGQSAGTARVFSGADGSELLAVFGDDAGDQLGRSVDAAGDIDGDGHDDIVVGIPYDDDLEFNGGALRVCSGLDGSILLDLDGDGDSDQLGRSVAGLGDADGDGVADVAAGAFRDDDTASDAGSASVHSVVDIGLADLGGALAGATGPELVGVGSMIGGSTFQLRVRDAPPLAPTYLVLGFSAAGLPFKGGTLVPSPDLLLGGLLTSGAGTLHVLTSWPAGIPAGIALHVQLWFVDATGPAGFTATNGVLGATP